MPSDSSRGWGSGAGVNRVRVLKRGRDRGVQTPLVVPCRLPGATLTNDPSPPSSPQAPRMTRATMASAGRTWVASSSASATTSRSPL